MMFQSNKIRLKKGLVRMNKISYMFIALFLIISLGYYRSMSPMPMGTVILIECLTVFIVFGGMKNMLGIALDNASDGVDLPGVDL